MILESPSSEDFGEVLRANRVPLTLIGIGVAWLVANTAGVTNRMLEGERAPAAQQRFGELASDGTTGGVSAREGHAPNLEGGFASNSEPTNRGGGWVNHEAGAAKGAISSVRDAGSAVLDRASRYTDYASEAGGAAKRAGGQIAEKIERDPWAIGVAGLVAGALVAALLPATTFEQEAIGEAREELWRKAAQFGHDAAERVRELADATSRPAPT